MKPGTPVYVSKHSLADAKRGKSGEWILVQSYEDGDHRCVAPNKHQAFFPFAVPVPIDEEEERGKFEKLFGNLSDVAGEWQGWLARAKEDTR